jgi:hypothetical protein
MVTRGDDRWKAVSAEIKEHILEVVEDKEEWMRGQVGGSREKGRGR